MKAFKGIFLTTLSYVLAARLGFYLSFSHTVVVPLWAPAGVALAMVLIFGPRLAGVGIILASVISSSFASWNTPDLAWLSRIGLLSAVSAGRLLEAYVGYRLVSRFVTDEIYSSQRNVFRFMFISSAISLIGSGIMVVTFEIVQTNLAGNPWKLFFNYSLGNLVGILLFAPLILLFRRTDFKWPAESSLKDFGIFALLASLVIIFLNVDTISYPLQHALPFMVVPYLLWLASRYSLTVAFSAVFITSILALYYTVVVKESPFIILNSGAYSMLYFQVFIAVISFSTLLLGAATKERNLAQKNLKDLNENLEHKVQERTAELIKRNTELDNFVYHVSHDLRAPIASILGLINVAAMEKEREQSLYYLELIRKSALKQDEFIREILDHAKNSRTEPKSEEIFFEQLILQVWNVIQAADVKTDINISINQSGPFISDTWRMQVILHNILSNAIRYRKGNSLDLKISGTVAHSNAEIVIEDNGQGIRADQISKVFDMFYRASEHSSGSGLGLYIVKETVTKLGGNVSIFSAYNSGTRVSFSIPPLTEYQKPNGES